jgi:hypothetical protein
MDVTASPLHWVLNDLDAHAVCGADIEGKPRTTDMEFDDGEPHCSQCYVMWTRHTLRMA